MIGYKSKVAYPGGFYPELDPTSDKKKPGPDPT